MVRDRFFHRLQVQWLALLLQLFRYTLALSALIAIGLALTHLFSGKLRFTPKIKDSRQIKGSRVLGIFQNQDLRRYTTSTTYIVYHCSEQSGYLFHKN
jgi:hypothetical protein